MNQLVTYWLNLKPNEQLLLKCAAAVFSIFVVVMLIIRPLNNKIDKAQNDLLQQQELLQYVKQSAAKVKASGGSRAVAGGSLSQIINTSSRRANIQINKISPTWKLQIAC